MHRPKLLLGVALLVAAPVTLVGSAAAFCGFYVSGADAKLFNNATQVVLMREGARTVLSMQNNYLGPPEDFALVVPVPVVLQKENVKTLDTGVFDRVDRMASPRLVEYWEVDPCHVQPPYEEDERRMRPTSAAVESGSGGGVRVEARFKVGEYDIVILSADDATGLDKWLRGHEYNIPKGAEPVLRPYVQAGTKFFVAKVDVEKVKFVDGRAVLSPLRFFYDSEAFSLPIRLGLINAKGAQDLIVHVLAQGQRYEVANYKNVTIPTNIDVDDAVRHRFGEFYAALFDATVEANPGAVVTEYSWDASTCDPCPGPTLTPEDFLTLGADALPSKRRWGYVLTRLHARYTKDNLGEDLVFKAAPPIAGGREHIVSDGKLEEGSQPAPRNNFQGRYIIRHPWEGKIACDNPVRGRWGGRPGATDAGPPKTSAATKLGDAKRGGGIKLASLVRQDVPEIKLKAEKVAAPAEGGDKPAPGKDSKTQAPPADKGSGSGCTATGDARPLWSLALAVLLAFGATRARRQRARARR